MWVVFSKVNASRSRNNIDLFISGIKFFYYLRNVGEADDAQSIPKDCNSSVLEKIVIELDPRRARESDLAECTKDSRLITACAAVSER